MQKYSYIYTETVCGSLITMILHNNNYTQLYWGTFHVFEISLIDWCYFALLNKQKGYHISTLSEIIIIDVCIILFFLRELEIMKCNYVINVCH